MTPEKCIPYRNMNPIDALIQAGHHIRPTAKGSEYIAECPTCGRQKLYINPEKKCWNCFYCTQGGRSIRSLFRLFGITYDEAYSYDYARLREKMSAKSGIVNPLPAPLGGLPPEYKPLYSEHPNEQSFLARAAIEWLHRRGVTDEQIKLWNLGYFAPGQMNGYIIIPVCGADGKVETYQTRCYIGNRTKSLNPPGAAGALFNLPLALTRPGLVVVEGPFDAMSLHSRLGDIASSAVALLGHACSTAQAATIARIINPEICWVMLDPDVGPAEKNKVGKTIRREGVEDVRIANPKVDPDELSMDDLLLALDEAVPVI